MIATDDVNANRLAFILSMGAEQWNEWVLGRHRPHRRLNFDESFIKLSGSRIENVDFSGRILYDLDLSGSTLKNVNFGRCNLRRAKLAGAKIVESSFRRSLLYSVDFSGASLSDVDFRCARLFMCDFQDARASKCRFLGADICSGTLSKLPSKALSVLWNRFKRRDGAPW